MVEEISRAPLQADFALPFLATLLRAGDLREVLNSKIRFVSECGDTSAVHKRLDRKLLLEEIVA